MLFAFTAPDIGEKKGRYMKTSKHEDMRKEYKKGTNLVLLSPDVAKAFPDDDSVNEALRGLMKITRKTASPAKASRGPRG